MSDYELVDTFVAHAGLLITYFMGFISATSALLVVAHIAAHGIPPALARVAIGIYSITSVFLVASFHRISAVMIAIRNEMGESLHWHPVVREEHWLLPILAWSGVVAMVIIFCSAIWYFQHARNASNNTSAVSRNEVS